MGALDDLIIVWLSSLFLYTGVDKLSHLSEAQFGLDPYRFLLRGLARPIAIVMPFIEVGVGAALITSRWREAGLTTLVVGAAFATVTGAALLRRVESGCGCVASTSGRLGRTTFARAILIVAAGAVLFTTRAPAPVPAAVVIAAVVLAALALIHGTRDLVDVARRHRRSVDDARADLLNALSLLGTGGDVVISERLGALYVGANRKSDRFGLARLMAVVRT